jgi:hypothetical protein
MPIKRCVYCASPNVTEPTTFRKACRCGAEGPEGATIEEAIELWNRRPHKIRQLRQWLLGF